MRQRIRVGHSRPYPPQTQGKLERLHRSLKAELLQGKYFLSAQDIQASFDHWRNTYHLERPHEQLAFTPPARHYSPSPRSYDPHPVPPEYGDAMAVRKVDASGRLSFKGRELKVGEAFIHENLGIREEADAGMYSLWWYSSRIGKIDLQQNTITLGKCR